MRNKKGNVFLDIIAIPVILILVAFCMLFALKVWNEVKSTDIFETQDTNENLRDVVASVDTTTNMYPYIFVMLIASILVGLTITGYYIESSPVFLVVGLIIMMIGIVIAVPFSNSYEEIATSGDFAAENAQFNLIFLLMCNMPLIVLMISGAFLMALYSKKSGGGYY